MADIVTKIQFRQGTDAQRRTANSTGVVFSTGEPGFCIDTKRVFIGGDSFAGGWPVGIQNIGFADKLFGTSTNGFTTEALGLFNSKGAALGDIIYDKDTRGIYALTAVSSFPPLSSDFVKYDSSPLLDSTQFQYNSFKELQIKQGGVGPQQLGFTTVDNITLAKPSYVSPLQLKANGVANGYLAQMASYTVKINNRSSTSDPTDQVIQPNHVLGRTSTSVLTSVPFEAIFQEANYVGDNGILIDKTLAAPKFYLDTAMLSSTPLKLYLKKATDVQGNLGVTGVITGSSSLSLAGNATVQGTIYCRNDIIAYQPPSDIKIKDDIKLIDSPIEKVKQLNGCSFTFNQDAPEHLQNKPSYGLIAQDVERVLPHAIEERHTGIKGVNYNNITPLLVECIKKLSEKVEALENEIRKSS
jgi:hypothetical protein